MTHLILCREYPPAPYPAGGIGTYARHMARQLAEAGETVHIVGQLWEGAPVRVVHLCDGHLIEHRISVEEPIAATSAEESEQCAILHQLAASTCPSQLFSWQAARYVEALLEHEHIDVIEAQEWEAPLYYLLARRAAGLGPKQQPPCIVHLHSPTQMIFEYNEWDQTLTDFLPLTRFEEYTIRSADALLCPSRYLAKQVTDLFDLVPGQVEVIPYAMGIETPVLPRSPEVWRRDAICYVGRLELRKGIIEWVDAAIRVAQTHPTVSFDFFGGDTYLGGGAGRSVLEFLQSRIPRPLRARFRFHGSRTRAELLDALANVAIAVVPSRWENFPFTCIEAMSTGLPVLASPHGGMAEMVVDNESGWITEDGSVAGLEAGLRRALAASAADRAAMGSRAAETIRTLCNNDTIVARQIAFRQRVAQRFTSTPEVQTASEGILSKAKNLEISSTARTGMGIVLTCLESSERLSDCLNTIELQTEPPMIVLVTNQKLQSLSSLPTHSVQILSVSTRDDETAARLGIHSLLSTHPNLQSIAIINQNARLAPTYVESCERTLLLNPAIGLVSPWILRDGKNPNLDPGPSPMSPTNLDGAPIPPCSAVRVDLLKDNELPAFDAILHSGYSAFTFPGPLVTIVPANGRSHPRPRRRYSGMALIQSQSLPFALRWFLSAPLPEKARWLGRFLRQPERVTKWLRWQIRSRLRPTGDTK